MASLVWHRLYLNGSASGEASPGGQIGRSLWRSSLSHDAWRCCEGSGFWVTQRVEIQK